MPVIVSFETKGIPGFAPAAPLCSFYDVQYSDQIKEVEAYLQGRYGTMVKFEPYDFGRPVILSIARDLWNARKPWWLGF